MTWHEHAERSHVSGLDDLPPVAQMFPLLSLHRFPMTAEDQASYDALHQRVEEERQRRRESDAEDALAKAEGRRRRGLPAKSLSDRVQCGYGCEISERWEPTGGSWLGHQGYDEPDNPFVEAWFDYEEDPHALQKANDWLLDVCPFVDAAERLS